MFLSSRHSRGAVGILILFAFAACGDGASKSKDAGDAPKDGSTGNTNTDECGGCATGEVCQSSGRCCKAKTCADVSGQCGAIEDGCGGMLSCECPGNGTCGSSGICSCTPTTCEEASADCGDILDGCGGARTCGECIDGENCGGGGVNRCGTGVCAPTSCADEAVECGAISDGCSTILDCGACPMGMACRQGKCELCADPDDCDDGLNRCQGTTLDCPEQPCGSVLGCVAGLCQYEPFSCAGDGQTCPVFTCEATQSVVGSRVFYDNQCVEKASAACVDRNGKSGTCNGASCVTGERKLLSGTISTAGPLENGKYQLLEGGFAPALAGPKSEKLCNSSGAICVAGGIVP